MKKSLKIAAVKIATVKIAIVKIAIVSLSLVTYSLATFSSSMAEDKAMMEAETTKPVAMEKMLKVAEFTHQEEFTADSFHMAQSAGTPFLIAFHKKGCPLCKTQQDALNELYTNPAHSDLKVLVVDYDNDTASLKQFKVGQQGTLILYTASSETRRAPPLTKAADIEAFLIK
jgi:thiol-disulfide isomerase/thioredoxin